MFSSSLGQRLDDDGGSGDGGGDGTVEFAVLVRRPDDGHTVTTAVGRGRRVTFDVHAVG